jgi:uncharacterized protein (TIGR02145 family)
MNSSGTLTDLSDGSYTIRPGYVIQSFTDATGAPGIMNCIIPANPTGIPNLHCGAGEITISATPPDGCTIDWYTAAIGGTPLLNGNENYTTPSIASSTTYYAQARDTITHCVSAARTPVVATVNTIPILFLSSGTATASQTVEQNTPITAVTFTAESATIALSSGSVSLPVGVSGTMSGNPSSGTTFTISGTPTSAGTFNYAVTATHVDGGCTASLAGAIMVKAGTPPAAASTQTWTYGALTWSNRINTNQINCSSVLTPSTSTTSKEYVVYNGAYYYNWDCMMDNLDILCPSPWHAPSYAETQDLINRATFSDMQTAWGTYGLIATAQTIPSGQTFAWTTEANGSSNAYAFDANDNPVLEFWTFSRRYCLPVVCVK